MGFFKKVFASKEIVVDPEDLRLPSEIPTDKLGLTLKKSKGQHQVDIDIVGESFRAANVAAVAKAAEGKRFDIYLLNEPRNQYDKNAVAVMAAGLHVGYIGKPANKQWFKRVNEALAREELLWGTARAVSREGTSNTGIFGSIYMPKVGQDTDALIPRKMTNVALAKAIERSLSLSDSSDEPETVAQLKALCKKAEGVAKPLAAHAKWVEANPEGQDADKWEEVLSACEDIFNNASEAAYASDEVDLDALGGIQELADLVRDMKP
jgi:hypothetical protein